MRIDCVSELVDSWYKILVCCITIIYCNCTQDICQKFDVWPIFTVVVHVYIHYIHADIYGKCSYESLRNKTENVMITTCKIAICMYNVYVTSDRSVLTCSVVFVAENI